MGCLFALMASRAWPCSSCGSRGSAARQSSRIEPVEVARDPNIKPGQECIGDQEEC